MGVAVGTPDIIANFTGLSPCSEPIGLEATIRFKQYTHRLKSKKDVRI